MRAFVLDALECHPLAIAGPVAARRDLITTTFVANVMRAQHQMITARRANAASGSKAQRLHEGVYYQRAARNVALIAASAYLVAAIAFVSTAQQPICHWSDAVRMRSAADRSAARQDYQSAAQDELTATRDLLACPSVRASLLGGNAVALAGIAYARSRVQRITGAIALDRPAFDAVVQGTWQMSQAVNPYAALLRPITAAIAAATMHD